MLPTVIVLAAGRGERFIASGGTVHKLQVLLDGKRILDWTLDAVRGSGLPFHIEETGLPGMGDSIAAAVRATSASPGWLILPADLPLISVDTLMRVAQALTQGQRRYDIVFPQCDGQRGHPVGFSMACRADLLNFKGNMGAASIIHARTAMKIIVKDVGCVMDIDTLQDLQRAQNHLNASSRVQATDSPPLPT